MTRGHSENNDAFLDQRFKKWRLYLEKNALEFVNSSHKANGSKIQLFAQSLYVPISQSGLSSHELSGKCAGLARAYGQALFLGKEGEFLNALHEASATFDAINQNNASARRNGPVLYNVNEQDRQRAETLKNSIDYFHSSQEFGRTLPASLVVEIGNKNINQLVEYVAGRDGDFSLNLATGWDTDPNDVTRQAPGHVMNLSKRNGVYAFFDPNAGALTNIQSASDLKKVLNHFFNAERRAYFRMTANGFRVEELRVIDANNQDPNNTRNQLPGFITGQPNNIQPENIASDHQPRQYQSMGEANGFTLHKRDIDKIGLLVNGQPANQQTNFSTNNNFQSRLARDELILDGNIFIQSLQGRSMSDIARLLMATKDIPLNAGLGDASLNKLNEVRSLLNNELTSSNRDLLQTKIKTLQLGHITADGRLFSLAGKLNSAQSSANLYLSALKAIRALNAGKTEEGILGVAEVGSALGGIGVEAGLTGLGNRLTKLARLTRLGQFFKKAGGVIGELITLPVSLYTMVNDFSEGVSSSGNKATQAFVRGGFTLTGVIVGLASAAALAAGVSWAGPLGLLAGSVLVVGQTFYQAAQSVGQLEEWYPMSVAERTRNVFRVAFGFPVEQSVLDEVNAARFRQGVAAAARSNAESQVQQLTNQGIDTIVQSLGRVAPIDGDQGDSVTAHAIGAKAFKVLERDDVLDLRRSGQFNEALVVSAANQQGSNQGAALINLGDGQDTAHGYTDRDNIFVIGNGQKQYTGGNTNDSFLYNKEDTNHRTTPDVLDGGTGNNTLLLEGHPDIGERFDRPNRRSRGLPDPVDEPIDPRAQLRGRVVDLRMGVINDKYRNEERRVRHHNGVVETRWTPDYQHTIANVNNINNVKGFTGFDDTIHGDSETNILDGRGGNDYLYGHGGKDILIGRDQSRLEGGAGQDVYMIMKGNSIIWINNDVNAEQPELDVVALDYHLSDITAAAG